MLSRAEVVDVVARSLIGNILICPSGEGWISGRFPNAAGHGGRVGSLEGRGCRVSRKLGVTGHSPTCTGPSGRGCRGTSAMTRRSCFIIPLCWSTPPSL